MMLIRVEGRWINPDHIVRIEGSPSAIIHFSDGKSVQFTGTGTETLVEKLVRQVDSRQWVREFTPGDR